MIGGGGGGGGGGTGEKFEIFTCANTDRQAFGASAKDSPCGLQVVPTFPL